MSFLIPDHVLEEQIGDEIVLLSLSRETFYSLNQTGIELWAQLKDGADRDALVQYLCGEYGLGEALAQGDIDVFLGDLLRLELITQPTA